MTIAVQNLGLVMVLPIEKIRHMVVILLVMIMMVVTVKVVELLVVAVKIVMTANMIGLLTDLNAVIQHGMSLVLTAVI